MLVSTLTQVVRICSKISNSSSLTGLYRGIELSADKIRCCSEFGNIQIEVDATGLTKAYLLDVSNVLAVATSLPQTEEIAFIEHSNQLKWVCGKASGHWNVIHSDHGIPVIAHESFPWKPTEELSTALLLASSACQYAAVPIGMYGITIQVKDNTLHLMSCNSISLAMACIPKGTFPVEKLTLRPPVPGIIAALIAACPNTELDITEQGIFITGDWLEAHLPLSNELEHDLLAISDKFTAATTTAKINAMSVKKFIGRAKVMSDKHTNFTVGLSVENGKLVLSHSGISSATEEYFLAEGLPEGTTFQQVELPADMLVAPLGFVDTVVFDYLPEQQLVLKGSNPNFTYVIGGGE